MWHVEICTRLIAIKLPSRNCEDFIAWQPEANGIFTVRSAHRLGLQPALNILSHGQSSSSPAGDRGIWNIVWKAQVPPKLRIFAWKVATSTLAVRTGLHRRIQSVDPTCEICGHMKEDAHHALVSCTMARALRNAMRKHWCLPPESGFLNTGQEWFLNLLSNVDTAARSRIIFLLWRVWHHRNNVVHGDGKASLDASVPYLCNYLETFSTLKHAPDPKGKLPIMHVRANSSEGLISSWAAPAVGTLKVNVDAGWDSSTRCAGLGIISRDHTGSMLGTEWKHIPWCTPAEEAEVLACLEGLKHAINLQGASVTVESDCARIVQVLTEANRDSSPSWCVYLECQELLLLYRHIKVAKVDRGSNNVAHFLAQLGKAGSSRCLRDSAPDCVRELITLDCTNTM
jgi:ribonuclease HI